MLSRDDFVFTIGYDGPIAVIDGQAKKRYRGLSTRVLAEKGLYRAAYSSAIYSKDPNELQLVADLYNRLTGSAITLAAMSRLFGVILVDEAQFLTEDQVEDLFYITKKSDIKVFCFGLRIDFQGNLFPGSSKLFARADKIEELATLCSCGCGEKGEFNLRKVNNDPVFEGQQVEIDGFNNVTYESVCGRCYIDLFEKTTGKKFVRERKGE